MSRQASIHFPTAQEAQRTPPAACEAACSSANCLSPMGGQIAADMVTKNSVQGGSSSQIPAAVLFT
jgi:hypothetical protein